MSQKIKITQIKSSIGSVQKTVGTLRGLGLKKIQSTSILIETPEVLCIFLRPRPLSVPIVFWTEPIELLICVILIFWLIFNL